MNAGHNSDGMAEKDRKVLFFINRRNWLAAQAEKKAADAKMKNVGKAIKADLGEYGLSQIKAYEKAQTAEGLAELKAAQAAELQAMAFAGVPVNTQLDIFADLVPIAERAYNDGEEAGLRGDTLSNPFNESSHEGQRYAQGWHDGQGALFAGIKKKEAEASTDELIKGEDHADPGFPDEEEEAA